MFISLSILVLSFWSTWDSIITPSIKDVSILLLIATLVGREILLSLEGKWRFLARYLNIPILVFFIIFVLEFIRAISIVTENGG